MAHPLIYEVHARQWLAELSRRHGRELDLARIPEHVLEAFSDAGVTDLWVMGVWATGPRARGEALKDPGLRASYELALPGWTEHDVVGSPYAIADVQVADDLGGEAALAALRSRLAHRGIRLVLDFVPNHLGIDHAWLRTYPERFVGQDTSFPGGFRVGDRFLAHGKDPHFPGWTDTAQLDYRRDDTNQAMRVMLRAIATRCDGVRCDMAMLLLPEIFESTWRHVPVQAGVPLATRDFWSEAIAEIKRAHPGFQFIAEVYWELEDRLCALGFDYAYDKKLYDLLVSDRVDEVQAHVRDVDHARRMHFLENHDEPRIASRVAPELHRAAAALVLGLPGLRLLHDGQLEGARHFARIQLGHRHPEDLDPEIERMYASLLEAFGERAVHDGAGRVLAPHAAWDGNPTARWFTVIEWRSPGHDDRFELVVINLAPHRAQCRVVPSVPALAEHRWQLRDRLGEEHWIREGAELASAGLFLDLPAYGAQLFACRRA